MTEKMHERKRREGGRESTNEKEQKSAEGVL